MITNDRDVILSSRVRLARNFEDLPFPSIMKSELADETIRRAAQAMALSPERYHTLRMEEIGEIEQQALVERHLISLDLLRRQEEAAVMLREDLAVSIMINEEDHLRIQSLLSGQAIAAAAELAFEADDLLSAKVRYAFDVEWGYLTSCPTNTGTGMRASAMLHLPVLTQAEQIGKVTQAIAKLGLTIRGLYGEGSEAQGDLYQISNQVTLGRTEQEIIEAITSVVLQVAGWERDARQTMVERDQLGVEDKLMRSLGIMERARRMNGKEFMRRWSALRLAACLDIAPLECTKLDRLLVDAQPACLQKALGEALGAQELEEQRASLIRRTLT